CNNSSVDKGIQSIKDTLSQAQQNIQQDSANDEQNYKQQTKAMLDENNTRIDSLREAVNMKHQSAKDSLYYKQLDTLKQTNSELEARLTGYKETRSEKWRKFKYDLNRDIDKLGKSISRFGERNMRKNSN
ncbi:MAG TPA: hypothetical protein VNZ45_12165, partial [Bacteroidia bacterium]|nr:hypothetical protein [Bacteroidia bacterium]